MGILACPARWPKAEGVAQLVGRHGAAHTPGGHRARDPPRWHGRWRPAGRQGVEAPVGVAQA
jgi:hypothetical protein